MINNRLLFLLLFFIIIYILFLNYFTIKENMNNKKIALILFGISYKDSNNPNEDPLKKEIDFRESYENYNEKIIKYFKNKGYEIDIFASTNTIPFNIKDDLKKYYNPIIIIESDDDNPLLSRHIKLINGINSVLEYNNEYEFCILIRFDLNINDNFDNIDINKINIISKLENPELIDDNIYIIPYSKLKQFYDVLIDTAKKYNYFYHSMKHEFLKITDIHYIKNEENILGVGGLSFFTIKRNKKLLK